MKNINININIKTRKYKSTKYEKYRKNNSRNHSSG